MKTLDEYEKLATKQLIEGQNYFTTDVSIRMHILAMQDFLRELPGLTRDDMLVVSAEGRPVIPNIMNINNNDFGDPRYKIGDIVMDGKCVVVGVKDLRSVDKRHKHIWYTIVYVGDPGLDFVYDDYGDVGIAFETIKEEKIYS